MNIQALMYAPSLATRQPSGISSPDPCAGKAQINEFTKGRLGNLRQHLSGGKDAGQAPEAWIMLSTMSSHLATGLK